MNKPVIKLNKIKNKNYTIITKITQLSWSLLSFFFYWQGIIVFLTGRSHPTPGLIIPLKETAF